MEHLRTEIPDPAQARLAYSSIEKVVHFDMSLAIDTYIAANLDTIARHQAAVRELSTPVIRVYERVLLLPINDTPNSAGILPGKLYEYLSVGRPILAIGPSGGDVARVLGNAHQLLPREPSPSSQADIRSLFDRQGPVVVHAIEQYDRRELARAMAELLSGLPVAGRQ